MNTKLLLAGLILNASPISHAGIKAGTLQLNPETFLTYTTGVVIPSAVIDTKVGQFVCIYLMDGTCYKGQITEIEAQNDTLKIYGKCFNPDGAVFGFGMNKKGDFGGALIDKKSKKTYGLEFSADAKGYVFMYDNRYNKEDTYKF